MESIVHIELEPERILELCEAHFKKLRNFLGTPSVTVPTNAPLPTTAPQPIPSYWNVVYVQDPCQHEYDYSVTAPYCRKCGKPAHVTSTAYIISSSPNKATLDP